MRIVFSALTASVLLVGACKSRDNNESSTMRYSDSGAQARAIIEREASRYSKSYARLFDNHNETHFKMTKMAQDGRLPNDERRTIIHFDNHADLYRNDSHLQGNINIGNYINTMIWKKQVRAVWWIIPDETRSAAPLPSQPGCESMPTMKSVYWDRTNSYTDWQFRDGPADQLICVSPAGHFSFKSAQSSCAEGHRTVKFYKRTLSDVLNSQNAKIEGPTILDIDTDFFDNSGNYSNYGYDRYPRCYNLHHSPARLDDEFTKFARVITEKMDLKPDFIGIARSPGYTVQNQEAIFSFFQFMCSKAKNCAESYE